MILLSCLEDCTGIVGGLTTTFHLTNPSRQLRIGSLEGTEQQQQQRIQPHGASLWMQSVSVENCKLSHIIVQQHPIHPQQT